MKDEYIEITVNDIAKWTGVIFGILTLLTVFGVIVYVMYLLMDKGDWIILGCIFGVVILWITIGEFSEWVGKNKNKVIFKIKK